MMNDNSKRFRDLFILEGTELLSRVEKLLKSPHKERGLEPSQYIELAPNHDHLDKFRYMGALYLIIEKLRNGV